MRLSGAGFVTAVASDGEGDAAAGVVLGEAGATAGAARVGLEFDTAATGTATEGAGREALGPSSHSKPATITKLPTAAIPTVMAGRIHGAVGNRTSV